MLPPAGNGTNLTMTNDITTTYLSNSTTDYQPQQSPLPEVSPLGAILLTTITFSLFCCIMLTGYLYRQRAHREYLEALHRGSDDASPRVSRSWRRSQRYAVIEEWLVTKPVLAHDDICAALIGNKIDVEAAVAAPSSSDWYDEDDDDNECPICLAPLLVGELVSWSSNAACNHVFHHRCIKSWLTKHLHCPFCRLHFLPVDQHRVSVKDKLELADAEQERRTRCQQARSCFYCAEHGIVHCPPSRHEALKELNERQHEILDERLEFEPSLEALLALRGKCKVLPEEMDTTTLVDEFNAATPNEEIGLVSPTQPQLSADDVDATSCRPAALPVETDIENQRLVGDDKTEARALTIATQIESQMPADDVDASSSTRAASPVVTDIENQRHVEDEAATAATTSTIFR